ncbi:hypothetical protein ACFXJ8_22795 [Nonomuraea sp. NPDC059194]|uniref:hypothetical protein n=1 Tax=Nonomuraea sp. NPDC059194 TaxID=3346764 RepID=UPI0036BA39F3
MTQHIALDQGWVPSACTLPTAEQPLRVAEFDALFADAVRQIRRHGREHLLLDLAFTPKHAARAAELAARENGCCSFFTFALTGSAMTLEVRTPVEHADVLDALQARASTAAHVPVEAAHESARTAEPAEGRPA